MLTTPTAPPVFHAVIANRSTGTLRTVPASTVPDLPTDWIVICHDADLAPESPVATNCQEFTINVIHHHNYGNPERGCIEPTTITVAPNPQDWTAADLAELHHIATDTLRASRLIWSIETVEDRRRASGIRNRAASGVSLHVAVKGGERFFGDVQRGEGAIPVPCRARRCGERFAVCL